MHLSRPVPVSLSPHFSPCLRTLALSASVEGNDNNRDAPELAPTLHGNGGRSIVRPMFKSILNLFKCKGGDCYVE